MPPAARKGDSIGHAGTAILKPCSDDTLINNRKAARQSDIAVHIIPHPPHEESITRGSSSVFINGLPAARIGDPVGCGGKISSGSCDVNIGG